MANSINKAIVLGNLTRDPDIRTVSNGQICCSFSIATNRQYESQGARKEEASFHAVVTWGKLAELCGQHLQKGKRVYVEGRMHNKDWETTEGDKRSKVEIVAETVVFLDKMGKSPEISDSTELFLNS
jgi:single-strand DNA-binding protein